MQLRKPTRIVLMAVCTAAVLAAVSFYVLYFTWFGVRLSQNPGAFHRAELEAVVRQVRAVGLVPGEERRFKLDSVSDPKSLRPVEMSEYFPSGRGVGIVWAEMTANGNLKVAVMTRDLGHAGEYGFAYSDIPLSSQLFGDHWHSLDVPGSMTITLPSMRIDDNWWEVINNLR